MDEQEWTVDRMRPLVARWDEFVRTDRYLASVPWRQEIIDQGSVLRPPASEEEIRAAEDRLGVAHHDVDSTDDRLPSGQ